LESDHEGGQKDYLTYSLLGLMLNEGRVRKVKDSQGGHNSLLGCQTVSASGGSARTTGQLCPRFALEIGLAGVWRNPAGPAEADARLNGRISRIEARLDRIEKRLELADA
jgi:hypothetical protein